ncbi:MAG: GntR family transcriptional regulator [Peptostreptococcaceae bacterium]|nr:GntR family transcriptional regulator [Peptostreptococcaceae bacterium]
MTLQATKVVNSPSLVEIVRASIIEDIMEGTYLPGQKLPILEAASRYGVSETPVKQAFNRLVSEGMLEVVPRRGVIVRRVTKEDVQQLMEARQMINLMAMDASMTCSSDDWSHLCILIRENLGEHERLLDGITAGLTIGTYLRYVEIDREYHMHYLQCIHNRPLNEFYERLYSQAYAYVSISDVMLKRMRLVLVQHTEIFDAWAKGDYERMVHALKQHKTSAIDTLNRIYKEERS